MEGLKMNKISKEELEEVINEFQYEGKLVFIKPYGSGHINDTFLLKYEIGYMGSLNVILQRMNREIFETNGKCHRSYRTFKEKNCGNGRGS